MKKLIALIIAVCLLCGCAAPPVRSEVTTDMATSAATPNWAKNLPQFGKYAYTQGDAAEPLVVEAEASDGGTITYQWYVWKSEEVVDPLVVDATEPSFTPPTDEIGTYHYYCRATNTYEGLVAFADSYEVTVSVIEADTGGDTGGGTGGGTATPPFDLPGSGDGSIYSNLSLPIFPAYDPDLYPNVMIAYYFEVNAVDYTKARVAFSQTPIYYDPENKWVTSDSECVWLELPFGETDWGDAGTYQQAYMPGLMIDGSSGNPYQFIRVWSPNEIYDTDGNLYQKASTATPIYLHDSTAILSADYHTFDPGWKHVYVPAGREMDLQFRLITDYGEGSALDNSHYSWVVTILHVDGGSTDVMTIDDNGLLHISNATKNEDQFIVYAYDASGYGKHCLVLINVVDVKSFLVGFTFGLAGKPLPLARNGDVT